MSIVYHLSHVQFVGDRRLGSIVADSDADVSRNKRTVSMWYHTGTYRNTASRDPKASSCFPASSLGLRSHFIDSATLG